MPPEETPCDDSQTSGEGQFRLLFACNPCPMWICDRETLHFLEVNEAAVAVYGYTREAFLRMGLLDIWPAEEVPRLMAYLRQPQTGSQYSPHWQHRRMDGRLIDVETMSHGVEWNGHSAVLVMIHDIGEHRQAEERLQRRAAQLEALRQVGLELTAELDRDLLLQSIMARVVEICQATAGVLYLHRPELEVLELVTTIGPHTPPAGTRLRRGEGPAGAILEKGEPLIINGYRPVQGTPDACADYPWAAIMGAPLRWGADILGVLIVRTDLERSFSADDGELLSMFANQAAVAVANANLFSAIRKSAQGTQALYETGRALSSSLQEDSLMRAILEAAYRSLGYEYAVIATVDEAAGTVGIRHGIWDGQFDLLPDWIQASQYPLDHPDILADICRTGRTEIISGWDERFNRRVWEQFGHERLLRIFIPIRLGERVIGVMEAGYDRHTKAHISDDEVQMLEAFTDQAAIALGNARLLAEAEGRAEQLALLYEAGLMLNDVLEPHIQLQALVKIAMQSLRADRAEFFRYEADTDQVRFELSIGADPGVEEGIRGLAFSMREPRGIIGKVASERRPFVIPDVLSEPLWVSLDSLMRSGLWVPVMHKNQLQGVLCVLSKRPRAFSTQDERLLTSYANQAAIALENARLYDQVRHHASELELRVAQRTAELLQREAALSDTAARLRASNQSLQEAMESLQVAAEKLKQLDRLKSQFISNISHELRTPLANIKLYLSLLERGKPGKQAQYLATLNRETELLHRLIEDVLNLSHMDLGQAQLAQERLDLNQFVTILVSDRTALVEQHGLTLNVDLAGELPSVLADSRLMTQVLTNLMSNAMNYTPPGGTLTVSTRQVGEWVTLAVSDTGPGIPAEEQPHLFERFYRGRAALRENVPGTGLGLSICQEIVQRHAGRLTVDSQVGTGSTFTVWLPADSRRTDASDKPPDY